MKISTSDQDRAHIDTAVFLKKESCVWVMPFWGSNLYYHYLFTEGVWQSESAMLERLIYAQWFKYPYHRHNSAQDHDRNKTKYFMSSFSSSARILRYLICLVNVWIVEHVSQAVLILHLGKEHLILKPTIAERSFKNWISFTINGDWWATDKNILYKPGYDPWLQG